jgi:hypothetical protein
MIEYRRRKLGSGIVLLIVSMLSQRGGKGQSSEQSPSDLIRDKAHRPVVVAGSCGDFHGAAVQNSSDLQSMVRFRASAIPAIDAALDSIDKKGRDSEFNNIGSFLLIADARLKGAAAFPELRQMRGNPRFTEDIALDAATALSLGLTSYVRVVSYYRELFTVDMLRDLRRGGDDACSSGFTPQQALDFMILAWEKGDRAMLEESLGPTARAALDSLLKKDTSWDAMRSRLWHIALTNKTAVGYRFNDPGYTPLPYQRSAEVTPHPENPELDTFFKDGAGKDCGRLRIRFLSPDLVIDNADIGGLLSLISRCAENE